MKKLIITTTILILGGTILAQKMRDFGSCPYEIEIRTLNFIVLDINYEKNVVAFKHVFEMQTQYIYTSDEDEAERHPVNCNYAGMEEYPYAGVVLGIYDLSSGEYLKTFTTYKSCYSTEQCFDYETSAKNLDSAKQLFAKYNLNIENKPKPIDFTHTSDDEFKVSISGIDFFSKYENNYNEGHTKSYLYANDKLLYWIEQQDFFIMASRGEIRYISAYSNGKKIVFLNKLFHENHLEGPPSYEFYHFTPVFDIETLKKP
ncbi:MAG: hypothetical protein JXL97_19085 [Bacteroidales bacterium]|nr:hypothetical protein [Bacteroidales bacterium]